MNINMRRVMKAPTLRMMEGGEMPSAGAQMYGRASANLASMVDTSLGMSGVKPMSAPGAAPAGPQPTSRHDGMFSNPLVMPSMPNIGMKNGGDLRTGMGGHVPGSGSGDKIDAKYEPGEFVVSNDMLEKAPGLRDMLHGLRSEALADKGMTPEQADAKAVSGGGLRAQSGYSLDQIPRDRGVPVNNPIDSSELSRNVNNGLNALGGMGVMASVPLRGAQAASGAANAGKGAMSAAPILTNGTPRLAAPAVRAVPDFIAGVGEGATVVGRAASNLPAVVTGGNRALSLTDNAVKAAKTTNVALQEGAQANSMAALARTAANANAASSAGGNALSAALPAQPFTSQVPSAVAAPAQTAAPAPTGLNAKAYSLRQGTLGENDNAYHGDLTNKINAAMKSGQTDLASTGMRANDIYKTTSADGTTSYSGYGDGSGELGNLVSGDGTELRGRGSVSSVPGMSKELIAQTLRNPDGSAWSAQDNARMAANLRDGADPYAGTSRMAEEAAPKRGEPGYNRYQATKTARDQNAATLRGQDMEREDRLATAAGASASAARAQANDDRKYELDVARLGLDQANKKQADKRAGEKAFDDRVLGMVGVDKEGKPDMGAASAARNTMSAFLAERQAAAQAALKKNPNDKQAAGVLKDIEDNGLAGVDEETLRKVLLDQKAKSVANKGAGWSSWGGTAANSDKPLTSLRFEDSWLPFADKYKGDNGLVLTDDDFEANPDFMQFLGAKAK